MNALEELRALGVEVQIDSGGLLLRGPAEAFSSPAIPRLRARRAEIVEALLGERATAPSVPSTATRCGDCGAACGSAARCSDCAARRVPVARGAVGTSALVCPSCGGQSWRREAMCLPCEAESLVRSVA